MGIDGQIVGVLAMIKGNFFFTLGKSKLMTTLTDWMSIPRVKRSVVGGGCQGVGGRETASCMDRSVASYRVVSCRVFD